jgi:hypothetical protein
LYVTKKESRQYKTLKAEREREAREQRETGGSNSITNTDAADPVEINVEEICPVSVTLAKFHDASQRMSFAGKLSYTIK